MSIVNILAPNSNRQIKINFDGDDLSSDAGLLLVKEFVSKLGIDRLFCHSFRPTFPHYSDITRIRKNFFR